MKLLVIVAAAMLVGCGAAPTEVEVSGEGVTYTEPAPVAPASVPEETELGSQYSPIPQSYSTQHRNGVKE